MDADTAIRLAQESSKKARTLRACISAGNAREIELDLNPELIQQLSAHLAAR